eukprot:TRINITY_DN3564_c0_g1_i1.p1 TRINITY_DN3564_c0_g1~~TRINITY_DN3564_c0_g1_i1.p1  ORF type:complete len:123 (-),score=12.72 TRINITY_DN3564_c0_g1_i1:37-405(-)
MLGQTSSSLWAWENDVRDDEDDADDGGESEEEWPTWWRVCCESWLPNDQRKGETSGRHGHGVFKAGLWSRLRCAAWGLNKEARQPVPKKQANAECGEEQGSGASATLQRHLSISVAKLKYDG